MRRVFYCRVCSIAACFYPQCIVDFSNFTINKSRRKSRPGPHLEQYYTVPLKLAESTLKLNSSSAKECFLRLINSPKVQIGKFHIFRKNICQTYRWNAISKITLLQISCFKLSKFILTAECSPHSCFLSPCPFLPNLKKFKGW